MLKKNWGASYFSGSQFFLLFKLSYDKRQEDNVIRHDLKIIFGRKLTNEKTLSGKMKNI